MGIHEFGNKDANIVLIQMVDSHDLEGIENEIRIISDSIEVDFYMAAVDVADWNQDLSPWKAPAVFGKNDFGDGASVTLEKIKKLCEDRSKTYYIGGYSLAGLFAIWASYQTDIFRGVAAASPSMWFPGFVEYMKDNTIWVDTVYLSLGDKEHKARNPVMASVKDKITEAYEWLKANDIDCILEWNEGNHFKDFDIRTAKAFSWIMNRRK